MNVAIKVWTTHSKALKEPTLHNGAVIWTRLIVPCEVRSRK
jgi:hypothetical protein